ncbi:MAG: hypothetical protein ABW189_05725 [Rickettsiales bacterium]
MSDRKAMRIARIAAVGAALCGASVAGQGARGQNAAVDRLKQAIKGEAQAAPAVKNAPETASAAPKSAPSLMFSENEREWVERAIKSYATKIPVSVLLPQLFPSEAFGKADTANIPPPAPIDDPDMPKIGADKIESVVPVRAAPNVPPPLTFNSYILLQDKGKRVWLNGAVVPRVEDFTLNDVHVAEMQGERIYFIWRDSRADMFHPEWKRDMAQIGKTDFYTNGKNIVVDSVTLDVGFFLKPGETFEGQTLSVREGSQPERSLPAKNVEKSAPASDVISGGRGMQQALAEDAPKKDGDALPDVQPPEDEALDFGPAEGANEATDAVRLPKYMNKKDRNGVVRLYYLMTRDEARE